MISLIPAQQIGKKMHRIHLTIFIVLSLCLPVNALAVDEPPNIDILTAPAASSTLLQGQQVTVKWRVTDAVGITLHTVSLYQAGEDKGILFSNTIEGTVEETWSVNAPVGDNYHLHFFALDNEGRFSEVDSQTFSIAADLVLDIPGHLLGDPDNNGAMTPTVGFGVNPVSGNFHHIEIDAALPGNELPFIFSRSYNNMDLPIDNFGNPVPKPLGLGWTHAYNIFLRFNSAVDQAEVFWGDGRRDRFQKDGSSWQPLSPGNFTTLEQGDGSDYNWRITTTDHTEFWFNASLSLSEIHARSGQTLHLEYQNELLSRIIDTAGASITFTYQDQRLTQINLPPSRTIAFEYINDGLLLDKVTDMRGNFHSYVYRNGYLLEIHRANVVPGGSEKPELQIIYDDNYRVSEQHTAHSLSVGNPGYLFEWDTPNTLKYNTPTGQGATIIWNSNGQVTQTIPYNYPEGMEETVSFEASTGPAAVLPKTYTDLEGYTTSLTYDPDSPQSPSLITLPDGKQHLFDFNANHDLVSMATPEGLNSSFVLNTLGKPEQINVSGPGVPSTITTSINYFTTGDQTGREKSVEDATGGKVEVYANNGYGQPLEVHSYKNAAVFLTTLYTYDSAGRLISILDHRGTYHCFYYDNNDNVTDEIVGLTTGCSQAPASISVRHTNYAYDADDRVVSVTDGYGGAEARTISYTYDADTGMLTRIEDHGGARAVTFTYDNDGRLFKTFSEATGREDRMYEMASGKISINTANANNSQSTGSRIERREYDGNGNLINVSSCGAIDQPDVSSSDCVSDDRRLHMIYDNRDRVTQIEESLELAGWNPQITRLVKYTYTDDGRTVTVAHDGGIGSTDPAQTERKLEYDAAGRLLRATDFDDGVGLVTLAEYDGAGRVTKITDASGLQTTYTYDLLGRPLEQSDIRGIVRWSYDDTGGAVTRTEPDGATVVDTYDRFGQLIQRVTSDGNTFVFNYDSRGRLTRQLWNGTGGNDERNYAYSVYGELISVTGPFGQTISYTTDQAGRLQTKSYAGLSLGYSYNAFDQIAAISSSGGAFQFAYQDFTQALSSIQYPNGVATTYERNPLGELVRLSSQHSTPGTFLDYQLTLDAVGRRKEIQSEQPVAPLFPPQDYSFTFTSAGQLAGVNNNKVNYDQRGNILALPSPMAASFEYDVLNRLTGVDTTQHTYDAERNRLESNRNGAATRYLWDMQPGLPDMVALTDGNNQVQEVFIHGPGGLLAGVKNGNYRFVHQDFNHNVTALTDNSGTIAGAYSYTPYGLPAGEQGIDDFPFGFAGGVGVMRDDEGMIYMRARYYHPGLRRFTSADLVPGVLDRPMSLGRYGYVEGNILSTIDPTGMYAAVLGIGYSATFMGSVAGSCGLGVDSNIEFGIVCTIEGGGGISTPGTGPNISLTLSGAETVMDLAGAGSTVGASIPIGGIDYGISDSKVSSVTISPGIKANPTIIEMHGRATYTKVLRIKKESFLKTVSPTTWIYLKAYNKSINILNEISSRKYQKHRRINNRPKNKKYIKTRGFVYLENSKNT